MSAAFGSAVVEVGIGLAFMYLLLSLVVTVVNELIAQLFALRARTLEQGLVRLLEGRDRPTGGGQPINAAELLKLLDALRPKFGAAAPAPPAATTSQPDGSATPSPGASEPATLPARPAPTAATLLKHPLIVALSSTSGVSQPSYIPSREFALALLDIIAPDLDPDAPNYVALVRKAVTDIQGNDHLKHALLSIIDTSTRTVEDVRAAIEHWFNDAMDRVSGWYKRKVTRILFVIGLALTVLVNADSLHVAQNLWLSPTARSAVMAAAQDYVSKQPTPSATPAPSATPTFQGTTQTLAKDVAAVESSQLPIGWIGVQTADIWREVVGLLITSLAVSLGAPFWFDLLSLFVTVRNSGSPPRSTSTTPPAARTQTSGSGATTGGASNTGTPGA
ncbi:MAG TPA: hypothetical protein VF937_05335 [Chloroflexota bacterium]